MSESASTSGSFLQRLKLVEVQQQKLALENQELRRQVDGLNEWRRRAEDWIQTQFEVRFDSESVPRLVNGPTNTGADSAVPRTNYVPSASTSTSVTNMVEALGVTNAAITIATASDSASTSTSTPPKKRKTDPQDQDGQGQDTNLSNPPIQVPALAPVPVQLIKSESQPSMSLEASLVVPLSALEATVDGPGSVSTRTKGGTSTPPASTPVAPANSSTENQNGNPEPEAPIPAHQSNTNSTPVASRPIDEDAPCSVCQWTWAEIENNEMIFCDTCDLCVHQACYGLKILPDEDEDWFCKPCAAGVRKQGSLKEPRCVLCPNLEGAMVPVEKRVGESEEEPRRWVHNACVLWIPHVTFRDPDLMDEAIGVDQIEPGRWNLKCCFCKRRGREHGVCIQCVYKQCPVAFHVSCATKSGLIKMDGILGDEDELNPPYGVALEAFCQRHRNKSKHEPIQQ